MSALKPVSASPPSWRTPRKSTTPKRSRLAGPSRGRPSVPTSRRKPDRVRAYRTRRSAHRVSRRRRGDGGLRDGAGHFPQLRAPVLDGGAAGNRDRRSDAHLDRSRGCAADRGFRGGPPRQLRGRRPDPAAKPLARQPRLFRPVRDRRGAQRAAGRRIHRQRGAFGGQRLGHGGRRIRLGHRPRGDPAEGAAPATPCSPSTMRSADSRNGAAATEADSDTGSSALPWTRTPISISAPPSGARWTSRTTG